MSKVTKQISSLKKRRLACGLSLEELGALLQRDRSTLSRIENGHTKSVHPFVLREWERVVKRYEAAVANSNETR